MRPGTEAWSWSDGQRVTDLFRRLITGLDAPRAATVDTVVLAGDPADQVLGFAERMDAALIATGSTGYGFFERLIVGSVATKVLRGATVSVLVVPRPSATGVERIERQLASTGETSETARWAALLEAFSERKAGRATQLEIDDPALRAQLQETGYVLVGASYDRRDERLALILGASVGGGAHLTHTVGGVTSVAVLADPRQRDLALQAQHGRGQTIPTFLD